MLKWSFPLKNIKVHVFVGSLWRSIYIEGRWMWQGNAVSVDAVVAHMDAVKSAEQKGVARYAAYLRTTKSLNISD